MTMDLIKELFEKYSDELYAYLVRYVGDPSLAKDIVGGVFVKAMSELRKKDRGDMKWKPWFYRVATNCAISGMRKKKVRRLFLLKSDRDETASLDTPLHLVAGIANSSIARDVANTLLRGLDDPSALFNKQNNEGNTLMHRAIYLNNADMVRFLADTYGQYIDHTITNNDEKDLMGLARELSRQDIEQLLQGAGQAGNEESYQIDTTRAKGTADMSF